MSGSHLVLNRFFTQYVFEDLLQHQTNSTYRTAVQRYLGEETVGRNAEIIGKLYRYMVKNYRNEYIYQNTLFNKLLLGRHSMNTTTALTQVPIGGSKADFVLINGKATVYEIKTELDGLERLEGQVSDYYKAFDHVCVVTCQDSYERLKLRLADTPVGILILSSRSTLQWKKEPQTCQRHLSHEALFKILRKQEYVQALTAYFGEAPQATPAFFYEACLERFMNIPLQIAYALVLEQLKKRNPVRREYYDKVPYELKSLMYFYRASCRDYGKLFEFLNHEYRG